MWNEIRFAIRSLRRTPVFAVVATLTLALGVAANTAIFSLFYQVLLRSLPVPDPERLVLLHSNQNRWPNSRSSSDNSETVLSYPIYRSLRDGANLFNGLAARASAFVEVLREGGSDRVQAETVSGNFFAVLGVKPAIGRLLSPEDDRVRGASPVAVLSYAYWRDHFGASSAALNQKIRINGHGFVVVGVAPEGFNGILTDESPALFVPLMMKADVSPGWDTFDQPGTHWLNILGRIESGASRQQAQASLQPLWSGILRQQVDVLNIKNKSARQRLLAKKLELHPASQGINQLEGQWKKPLSALLVMVGLLLLIACANVANLLVARGVSRTREIAVRVAIGAGRWQIIRQSMTESLVLAAAGGLLGATLSFAFVRALLRMLPSDAAGQWLTATPDLTVLTFSLLLVALTTLLFGVLPAIQTGRVDPMPALKDQTLTASANGVQTHWRQALVAGQLALSLSLLVGAGLFAATLIRLLTVNPGFRPDRLLAFSVDPALSGYSIDRGRNLYQQIQDRLNGLPGVDLVSMAEIGPFSNSEMTTNVTVEGFHSHGLDDDQSARNNVGPGYFRTIGTALINGREFDEHDRDGSAKVAIVNEAFAKHFLPGQNPIGRRMESGAGRPPDTEIVGVVKDIQNMSLRELPKPSYYFPFAQTYKDSKQLNGATFFIRSKGDLAALERDIRAAVHSIDANLPVFNVQAMTDRMNESVYTERLSAALAVAFGVLALLLAAIGLYGLIAYSVARRTTEIGIRVALGALPRQVLHLIMREVMILVGAGVVIGLPTAYALAQLMKSQLFGVKPENPIIFLVATATLLLAALIAGIVPASRATSIDPMDALRYE